MSEDDERPHEPFVLLTGKNAPVGAVPRAGPTMAQLNQRLEKLEILGEQVIKRIGQMALMVDGFGGNLNRRIDVLHEEAALLRASVTHPANDVDVTVVRDRTPVQRAAGLLAVPVRFAAYATAAAVALRFVGKVLPQYEQAIESTLRVFGL